MNRPRTPKLAGHVMARRHLIDGVERIALHDSRSGALSLISPSDWEIVRVADGALDTRSICDRVASSGHPSSQAHVDALFDELGRESLLEEEPGEAAPFVEFSHEALLRDARVKIAPSNRYLWPPPDERAQRSVSFLDDYELSCDGSGGCCSQYASIVLTPGDLENAMNAGLSCMKSGAFSRDPMMPFSGSRSRSFALPLVDGACSELTTQGRCGLHERGGADAKPLACGFYPATLVDDGEVIRASFACECDCVFRSVSHGARWAERDTTQGRDLPPGVSVSVLPDVLMLVRGVGSPRASVVAWSKRALREAPPENVVERLLAEAEAIRSVASKAALLSPASIANDTEEEAPLDRLKRAVRDVAEVAQAASLSANAWRSRRDRTRIWRDRLAEACAGAADPGSAERLFSEHRWRADELFFYRASLHGHAFLSEARPLALSLERAAALVLVTRALGTSDETLSHPLAVVLAVTRAMST